MNNRKLLFPILINSLIYGYFLAIIKARKQNIMTLAKVKVSTKLQERTLSAVFGNQLDRSQKQDFEVNLEILNIIKNFYDENKILDVFLDTYDTICSAAKLQNIYNIKESNFKKFKWIVEELAYV